MIKKIGLAIVAAVLLLPIMASAALTGQSITITSVLPVGQTSQTSSPTFNWTAPTNPYGAVTYFYALDHYSTLTPTSLTATINDPYAVNASKYFGTSVKLVDVVDGTYYFHVMAQDAGGPLVATDVYSVGPYILNTKPQLTTITPAKSNHTQSPTIKISGANLMQSGVTVDLYSNATGTVALTSPAVNSYGNAVTAQVPAKLAPGTYDVIVTNGAPFNKKATMSQAYQSSNNTPVPMAGITNASASFSVDTYTVKMSGASLVLSLDATASKDPDVGDKLSYAWTTTQPTNGGAPISFSGSTKQVTIGVPGSYNFSLVVSDGYASSATTVKVLVQSTTINNPPVAKLSATPSTVAVNGSVTLSAAQSSDPDGDKPLTYVYSLNQNASPKGASQIFTVTDSYSSSATYTPSKSGSYTAQVKVSDPYGASSTATVTFLVNTPPTANAGTDAYGSVNTVVTLDGYSSSDGDGGVQTLTYRWDVYSQPAGSSLPTTLTSTAYNPSFTPALLGDYVFKLTVNDGYANSTNISKVKINVISGFTITHDYYTGINLVPFSLDKTGYINASDFVTAVINANPTLRISVMYGWNNTIQDFTNFYDGSAITDFKLVVGQSYVLQVSSGNGHFSMTGQRPSSVTLTSGINLVAIPPSEKNLLINASDFVKNRMNSSLLLSMYYWNAALNPQDFSNFYDGSAITDFVLPIETNGFVLMLSGGTTYTPK